MVNSIYNYPNNNSVVSGVPKQPNKKQNFRQGVSVPVTTQNDTFVSSKTKQVANEGMSSGTKWAIGLGLTALVGAGIFLATRGKVKKPFQVTPPKQLAECIEFKPAQTIAEARDFAKNKLGVYMSGIDDVDVANGINEWLSGLKNAKGTYPKVIADGTKQLGDNCSLAGLCVDKDVGNIMFVNTRSFKNFDDTIAQFVKENGLLKKTASGQYEFVSDIYKTDFGQELLNRINNFDLKTATYKDKNRIFVDLKRMLDGEIVNGKVKETVASDFYFFNHELGHMRHNEVCANYAELSAENKGSKIIKDFLNEERDVASKVSQYATADPAEFVAETFAYLLDGRKFSNDVLDLYKKYGGPMI